LNKARLNALGERIQKIDQSAHEVHKTIHDIFIDPVFDLAYEHSIVASAVHGAVYDGLIESEEPAADRMKRFHDAS
jgi:GMP synthase PP-ATPase subunit